MWLVQDFNWKVLEKVHHGRWCLWWQVACCYHSEVLWRNSSSWTVSIQQKKSIKLGNWTWVWVNSRSWWWAGRPDMLQSMGSQRVGHDWVTELNWTKQRHNKETDLRWSLSPGPPKEAKTKSAGGTKLTLVTEGSGSSMCAKAHPGQSDLWMTLGQVFCSEHLSGTRLSGHSLSTFTMISSCLSILRFWKMTLCAWNQHLVVSISRITKTGRLTGNVLGC